MCPDCYGKGSDKNDVGCSRCHGRGCIPRQPAPADQCGDVNEKVAVGQKLVAWNIFQAVGILGIEMNASENIADAIARYVAAAIEAQRG